MREKHTESVFNTAHCVSVLQNKYVQPDVSQFDCEDYVFYVNSTCVPLANANANSSGSTAGGQMHSASGPSLYPAESTLEYPFV